MEKMRGLSPVLDVSGGVGVSSVLSDEIRKILIQCTTPKKVHEIPVRMVKERVIINPEKMHFKEKYRKAIFYIDKAFVYVSGGLFEYFGKTSLMMADYLHEYSEYKGYRSAEQFEQKYSKAELIIKAEELPPNTRLTYPAIKATQGYRNLSKRHIYAIIEIKKLDVKNKLEAYRNAFSSIS